ASIGSIILIFYFGRLLFNEKIGLMAAFLMSFFPLDVVYATQLGSDIPSAFFMALGAYVFLYAEMKRKMKYGLDYMLSGILIGMGYMIRESALLIALFFIAYIVYKRKIKRGYFLVPLGVLMIFAIESFIFFALTGDPIYRVVFSQQYNAKAVIEHNYFGRLDFPTGLLHYPWLFLTNNLLIYFYAFVLIALVYILIKRRKEAYIMLIWLIPLLLYLSFGSASLAQYIPFRAVDRYTSIFTVPAIILLAFFLSEKRAMIKKWIMPITLAFLLLASIGVVYVRENRHLLDNLRDVSPFLKGLDKAVFIDDRSLAAINYLSGYAINKNLNEYPDSLDKVKDSYIAINRHMIRSLKEANPKVKFPEEIE
ncbi:MAG: glycosyltransferase family 39 protein, partial [Nanoarchaeota archaeon]